MIISDLNHLEVVSEASSVVGGGSKKDDKYKKYLVLKLKLDINKQSNVSVIDQKANAESAALEHGKSVAVAYNPAAVHQSNKNH